jgi:hypothetical protein
MKSYPIEMFYDDEARVWVAIGEGDLTLALEGGSFDALIERVCVAAPEILELNNAVQHGESIDLVFKVKERHALAVA